MSDTLKNALRGDALESLKLNSGYKVLINEIIYPLYKDAIILLEDKEDAEARATIKALKHIVGRIDDQINLGKQSREEYKQELHKHTQNTPE